MRNIFTSKIAIVAWFLLLFSFLNEAKAQATRVDPLTAAQLQTALDNFRLTNNLKGLSASVIIPGKGTWKGVSGISHAGVSVDTAMAFGKGNITKNFTAAAILLLHEDRLLSINDSTYKYLPSYPNINPNITIKQLLQHTSGLADYFSHPNWINAINSNPGLGITPQFVLNNYINTPVYAPGVAFWFNHTDYVLLGLIIEQVTGQSCASFIRQRLLTPLQLSSLYAMEHEVAIGVMSHHWSPSSQTAPGTDITGMPLTAILATSAAAVAMFGNAYDLARWGQLLFTGSVLQNTSLQLMKQFLPVGPGPLTGIGLGLMRFGNGTLQTWGLNGNIRGFSSSLLFSPADSIVVSVSSNQPTDAYTLANSLVNIGRQQKVMAVSNEMERSQKTLVCFPNPVQGIGNIQYSLRKAEQVEITLHNSLGQKVKTLVSQTKPAGEHSLTVDTSTLPAGMYFCTLQTTGKKEVQRWVIAQ